MITCVIIIETRVKLIVTKHDKVVVYIINIVCKGVAEETVKKLTCG
jgi:hypothetical protein